jgi:hypothetical protein
LVPVGSDACKLSRTGWTRVNELLRMHIGATVSFAAPSLKRRNAEFHDGRQSYLPERMLDAGQFPSARNFWVQLDPKPAL